MQAPPELTPAEHFDCCMWRADEDGSSKTWQWPRTKQRTRCKEAERMALERENPYFSDRHFRPMQQCGVLHA
jgi:hypothetical protein